MKKTKALLLRVLIVFLIPFTASGQQSNSIAPVLSVYYEIKNALVSGDATSAAGAASRFLALVQSVDAKKLTSNENQVFNTVQPKLIVVAGSIAASRDLRKQRSLYNAKIRIAVAEIRGERDHAHMFKSKYYLAGIIF